MNPFRNVELPRISFCLCVTRFDRNSVSCTRIIFFQYQLAVFAAKTGKYHMARTALEESLWNNQPQLFNSIEAGQETNLDSPSRDDPKPQVKTIHTPLTYLWPSYIIYSVHGWHCVETTQDRYYVSTIFYQT